MNTIGSKIKTLAIWVSSIVIILCLIAFCYGLYLYVDNHYAIQYATILGGASSYYSFESLVKAGDEAISGLISMVCSILLLIPTVVVSFFMYGFGELLENVAHIAYKVSKLEKHASKDSGIVNS